MGAFSLWWMRRRWARRVRGELGLPPDPSLQDAIQAVSARRGRPIRLIVEPLQLRVSGYCAQSEDTDYIYVDAHASPLLQHQVVCHELMHLHLGHEPADHRKIDDEVSRALFGVMDPDIVRLVLGRDEYDEDAELEAEIMGTVLLQCLDMSPQRNKALTASFEIGDTGV
ncbi:hypothetical protein CUT44_28505 [Streptomyces carminius]|uniref:IrrE N-terminal-like domain-containing protein n=1 Tax=Streptomyces carminius TaxID=2665496 RepID=A0A2M8LQL2_9ACTN|nr:ImmA/IrrE family metallo-endopeptidase [Streptomyces carminius]PJE94220.1 hypothetical protein CUT44_28505 [Streptomyces carminius]